MDESSFHHQAAEVIERIYLQLESQDSEGMLDLEDAEGMLTIQPEGAPRPWVVSRHSAAREIWLSSPVSGGLHFRDTGGRWTLPDGRELFSLIEQEVSQASGKPFAVRP